MPPLDNATSHMPAMTDVLFGVHKGQLLMNLPGSNEMTSIPLDVTGASKEEQEKRNLNAEASRRHREKKKRQQNELSKEVERLRTEVREVRESVKIMEEEQNSCREFIGNLIRQAPWLSHSVQAPDFLPQTSNTVIRMDDFAARPQSNGGGSSPGEQPSKRRRTNQVHGFSTPAYEAFIDRRLHGLPPKWDLRDTSAGWFLPPNAGISDLSTTVASVR
jgi:hypothetical protein